MIIIGINGSPRAGKSTSNALKLCLEAASETAGGIEKQQIELGSSKISPCEGCHACSSSLDCVKNDDLTRILPLLARPDLVAIIAASPVYLAGMTSQLKCFWDRSLPLRQNGFLLKGKIGAALACGGCRNGGQEYLLASIHSAMLCHGMIITGDNQHFGGTLWTGKGDIPLRDEFGKQSALNTGKAVGELIKRLYS